MPSVQPQRLRLPQRLANAAQGAWRCGHGCSYCTLLSVWRATATVAPGTGATADPVAERRSCCRQTYPMACGMPHVIPMPATTHLP